MARIEERKNKNGEITSYRFRVSLGYDVHGKQILKLKTWCPPDGITKAQLKKELQMQAALFEAECNQDQYVDGNITFKQLYEMWWREYADINLKNTTKNSYKMMMPNVLDSIGHLNVNKIQPHHLNEFYAGLRGRTVKTNEAVVPKVDFKKYIAVRDGNADKNRISQKELAEKAEISLTTIKVLLKGNPISVNCAQRVSDVLGLNCNKVFNDVKRQQVSVGTIKRYHSLISGIFKHALTQGIISVNPCTRVRLPKDDKKEATFFEEDEAILLFDALNGAEEPFRTASRLCLFLGLRRGELCALSWDNVNFDRGYISIRKSIGYTTADGLYEDTPKTKTSIRDIKVSENIIEMLTEYRRWQEEYRESIGDKWSETNKVFTNSYGGWLRPDTYSSWFRRFCKANDFDNAHVHTLRHTAATLMIMNGIPLRVVSQRLGHNSTAVTNDIYAHVIQRADEMAADTLDKSLFKKQKNSEPA